MKIMDLFERPISRPINGVVKADQLDDASVWQELDEFVITRELDQHFRRFLSSYLEAIDRPKDPDVSGKIGVWVSGFFGSGKSHFIKVLAYLLRNQTHSADGESKQAVAFFEDKISDAMLLGDVRRAVAANTDVILFNIDSKADSGAGRDAILRVFLKVLNEMQGYSGDYPHIAHMERYLDGRGLLETFHTAFREATGSEWVKERDAYEFHRDEVVAALSRTLGQSGEAVEKWIDGAEDNFSLTVENFCKWVKAYLDSRGPDHRIIFLVDEVGQFIGGDTHLMLSLQTITEELGTLCGGRAWIVVTAQEDIDAVLGEMNIARGNDFSKIQGRFRTRLSLSSANVDEVIQTRLLAKREGTVDTLRTLFSEKGDILKNQLTFTNVGMTFKAYRDADDFVRNYPFAPYQFQLVQRIFEQIRKAGATGLHLSRGERSILDAFQSAGVQVADGDVGLLVPLYRFYPSIESFLDTAVKRTIDQAADNPSLEPFDIRLLEALFLIRYVDEINGNVDNMVTLCIDEIDADRLALRRQVEEGLLRLEKETLVSRSGDTYFFLTNEERDISREIKAVEIGGGEEAKLLGEIIFEDILKGQRKHRYMANKMDFTFTRICDMQLVGSRVEGGLTVSVITPLADDYDLYGDSKRILDSNSEGGQVLVKLEECDDLGRELRTYLKTDKYIRTKSDGTQPETTRRILHGFAEDNRERRDRLMDLLGEMLVDAKYAVAGQSFAPNATAPAGVLTEALEYLINNTFSKMNYIIKVNENPQQEVQAVLRSNDIGQQSLAADLPESNPQALEDLRSYIDLCARTSRQIVFYDLIEKRALRPYGWPQWETLLLIARMVVLGEIHLVMDGAAIPVGKVYEAVSTTSRWRKITVMQRRASDPKALQDARNLGKEMFSEMGPDGEDALFAFLQRRLKDWQASLNGYKALADTGDYPGEKEIEAGLQVIQKLVAEEAPFKFIERFNTLKDDLLNLADDFHDLDHFYGSQRATWDRLRKAHDRFQLNRMELERNDKAAPALKRMQEILSAPAPYGMIHEAEDLIRKVELVNEALVSERREGVVERIEGCIAEVSMELDAAKADAGLRSACLDTLKALCEDVRRQESIAHISQAGQEAVKAFDAALAKIAEATKKTQPDGVKDVPVVKTRRVVEPAKLMEKPYLETETDVDAFLDELGGQLRQAIANNERVEIR